MAEHVPAASGQSLPGHWLAFRRALDAAQDEGRRLTFWLRDDDAVTDTPALRRLLELTGHYSVPLLLAVIPKRADETLARLLHDAAHVSPCQHGYSHRNHAPPPARAQELGVHRPIEAVLGEVAEGRDHLQRLFEGRLSNAMVPPWNRLDDALVPGLQRLGFDAISRFGTPAGGSTLPEINATLDIIDWRNGRVGRMPERLLTKMWDRIGETEPDTIGVLTHHLDHDETAWNFLENLFALTEKHRAVRWATFDEMKAEISREAID